jgi:hypothetical protein
MTLPAGAPASAVPGPSTTVTVTEPQTPPAPPQPPNGQPKPEDKGFPEGVKVADMTAEQQAAYWKHYARQHENRVSALGNLTPEDVKALQDKAQQWDDAEAERGTETEKAVRSAYAEAEKAVLAKVQPQLVTAEFRAAATGRIDAETLASLLEPLDLSKFLAADGSVDTAKVSKYLDGIAPAMGSSNAQTPSFPSLGQGQHTPPPAQPGQNGLAAAQKRFGKAASPTT